MGNPEAVMSSIPKFSLGCQQQLGIHTWFNYGVPPLKSLPHRIAAAGAIAPAPPRYPIIFSILVLSSWGNV